MQTNIITVDKPLAIKVARSFTLYQYRQPTTIGLVLIMTAAIVAVSPNLRHHIAWAAVVAVLTWLITPLLAYRRVKKQLLRGYMQPGAQLSVQFSGASFKIQTETASSEHQYRGIASFAVTGAAVIMRPKNSKIAIVLPKQLVPPEKIAYVQQLITGGK